MQAELEGKKDQRSFRSATIRHELDDVKAEVQLLSEEVRQL
jgi:hypothetical protein